MIQPGCREMLSIGTERHRRDSGSALVTFGNLRGSLILHEWWHLKTNQFDVREEDGR